MTPRIAHLFLVRNNLAHEAIWQQFFAGHEDRSAIYVHAKWPEQVISPLLGPRQIDRHCQTEYATCSLVEAELLLLQAALEDRRNAFFLLHSESCIPLHPFTRIYKRLFEVGRSWIPYYKQDMWRYYGVNQLAIPRKLFYKAPQWFCLTRPHAELLLEHGRLDDWRECNCADEHYIPTVLALHNRLEECFECSLTFADWKPPKLRASPSSPTTFYKLTAEDERMLLKTPSLFARKFAPDSDIARFLPTLHHRTRFPAGRKTQREPKAWTILKRICAIQT